MLQPMDCLPPLRVSSSVESHLMRWLPGSASVFRPPAQAEAGELNRMRRRISKSAEHRPHRRPLPIGRGGAAAVKEKAATAAGERVRIILILRRIQTGN